MLHSFSAAGIVRAVALSRMGEGSRNALFDSRCGVVLHETWNELTRRAPYTIG